ncbi:hypothetical protein GCM10010196_00100 [Agromyces mediolanus]|uniref:Uncharacterized protein n=1 Tax=Agromyces mediolanus TaxID=41986 RepID=A0A918C911_AGRME|nr:hypothetical protein GCM10010196_00100 [Agromyces mediolanus]GLJ73263.1 hypothetical protein GCM10017583_25210 [Agromyces mediolanus]
MHDGAPQHANALPLRVEMERTAVPAAPHLHIHPVGPPMLSMYAQPNQNARYANKTPERGVTSPLLRSNRHRRPFRPAFRERIPAPAPRTRASHIRAAQMGFQFSGGNA